MTVLVAENPIIQTFTNDAKLHIRSNFIDLFSYNNNYCYVLWIVSGEFRKASRRITQHIGVLGKDVLVQKRWARVDHEGLQANYASLGNRVLLGLGAGGLSFCCDGEDNYSYA